MTGCRPFPQFIRRLYAFIPRTSRATFAFHRHTRFYGQLPNGTTIRIAFEMTRLIYEGSLSSLDTDGRDYGFFENMMHTVRIFDGMGKHDIPELPFLLPESIAGGALLSHDLTLSRDFSLHLRQAFRSSIAVRPSIRTSQGRYLSSKPRSSNYRPPNWK